MVSYPTFPHPDLIQTETWEVADDTRYHFVPGSVYLLGARLIYKAGESDAKDASARLFTTEFPDSEAADTNRCVVDLVNSRDQTSPHVFFEHGIYAETFTGAALEGAYLELSWVKRVDYCEAYWRTEDALQECWKNARGDEPFLDNFWRGNEDDTIWSNSGTPGSGTGGSDPEFPDTTFRIQDDGDPTKEIAFQASSISTATTRTITMPDNDVDLSDSGISASYATINPQPLESAMQIGTDTSTGEMTPALVRASWYQQVDFGTLDADLTDGLTILNSIYLDAPSVSVASDGATITLSLEKSGGGDLRIVFDTGVITLDCTPAATVALTAGTDAAPTENYIYVLESTGALTASTSDWPAAEHAPVATVVCQSAASLQTDGAYKVHAWTDHASNGDNIGHIADINHWIRHQHATYVDGIAPTLTITPGSPDTLVFTTTSGTLLQLHHHAFPAFSGTPDIYVINDSTTAYDVVTDLADLLTDSTGASMSGKRFSLVIWGVVSEDSADCKLYCNLPSGSYNSDSAVIADGSKYANFSIPAEYKGTGFLISELKLRHQTSGGGTWTSVQEVDLRGTIPNISAGGGSVASAEFPDTNFRIQDEADNTKQIAFEASSITTATTRTITMPDADVDLTVVPNTSGTNTGDEAAASTTVAGVVELATTAETDTGTDATRAVTPDGLEGSQLNKSRDRVFGVLETNGTGTPTLQANSLGLASVSRTALGKYAYTFSGGLGLTADAYTAILGSGIVAGTQFYIAKIKTQTASGVTIEVYNASTLALADAGKWPLTIKANI